MPGRSTPDRMAERKSFLLRIDPGLWCELEAWAADELRSVNGQIEFLLKQAVQRRKGRSAMLEPRQKPDGETASERGRDVSYLRSASAMTPPTATKPPNRE